MRIAATVAAAAGSLTCLAIVRRMPARNRAAASSHHGPGVASTIDAVLMVANRRSPLRASARSASGTPKLRYGNGRRTEATVARITRPRVQARRAACAESPRTVARTPTDVGIRCAGPRHARHIEVERDATTGLTSMRRDAGHPRPARPRRVRSPAPWPPDRRLVAPSGVHRQECSSPRPRRLQPSRQPSRRRGRTRPTPVAPRR